MDITELARAFATVFLAELPDKTMVATIVLTARYRNAVAVWLGASMAFAVHITVAVVAGSALGRLPAWLVDAAVFVLFAAGAVVMLMAARRSADVDGVGDGGDGNTIGQGAAFFRALAGSFAFIALAEWGDLTQIATAGLAARSDAAISVWVGALSAMVTVAALASSVGARLLDRIPVRRMHAAAAVVFASLAVWTLVELVARA